MKQFMKWGFAIGLCGYALFLPISISGSQIALALLILTTVVSFFDTPRRFVLSPVGPIILAWLVWVAFAAMFSVDPGVTFARLPRYWIFIGYFAVLRACTEPGLAIRGLKILVMSSGFAGLYGIGQKVFGNDLPRPFLPAIELWQTTGKYFHAVGFFDHHLTYGNALLLSVLAGIGLLAWHGLNRSVIPYGLAVAAATGGLVFSYARSAWMGLFAGIFSFGLLLGRKILVPLVIGFSLLVATTAALSPTVRFRLERTVSVVHNIERIAIWTTTVHMIQDHPVFGIGRGNYSGLTPKYRKNYNIHWTAKSHAHNSYFQTTAESGLPAGVLFFAWLATLFGFAITRTSRIENRSKQKLLYGLIAGHVGFAVSCFFQHNLGDAEVAMAWLFLTAVTFALIQDQTCDRSERNLDG